MKKHYTKNKSLRLRKKLTRRGGAVGKAKAKKRSSSRSSSSGSSRSSSRSSSPEDMLCKFNLMCKNGDYYESKLIYTSEDSARAAAKQYASTRGGVHRVALTCS